MELPRKVMHDAHKGTAAVESEEAIAICEECVERILRRRRRSLVSSPTDFPGHASTSAMHYILPTRVTGFFCWTKL